MCDTSTGDSQKRKEGIMRGVQDILARNIGVHTHLKRRYIWV